jgi:excisionase family DNA binding protein
MPEWLTAPEAAKYLRVDRTTIYRWEKAGILRSYPLPIRGRRFKQADLDALLESGGTGSGDEGTTRAR